MFEYYEVCFKFTTAHLQLHYGIYVIQHCRHTIDGNYVSWKYMVQKTTRDRLAPQVGGRLSHTLG